MMKKVSPAYPVSAALLWVFGAGLISVPAAHAADSIAWSTDYKAGLARASAEQKPVLIDFTAEWCGWCKRLDEEVYADASVVTALAGFVCLKIDVDKQPNIALAYNVQSMPRTIVLNIHNEVVGDLVGYAPLGNFLEFLEGIDDRIREKTGGMAAPVVSEQAAQPQADAAVTADTPTDTLVEMLGSPDPEIRARAAEAIAAKPDKIALLVAALGSEYLGARIAALETLRKSGAPTLPFDPWADKAGREAALAAWRDWSAKP